MKFFAVDAGSTYIKTALLDTGGQSITLFPSIQTPPPFRGTHGLFYEIDALALYDNIRALIDRAVDTCEPAGILFSTQMHGCLFVNRDGLPATPYISWQDTRSLLPYPKGGSYLEYLRALIPGGLMLQSGVHLKAGLGMCNAYTLLRERHYDIAPGAMFCTLGSYLIQRLCGNACTHITNAAPTGLANVVEGRWNSELIDTIGFSGFTFPGIISERQAAGQYRGVNIYSDLGDQQCCVLGGLIRPDTDININFGTGAQIDCISGEYRTGIFESRPFFDGYYLPTITRLPAGRNMDVIAAFLQDVAQTISKQTFTRSDVWAGIQESLRRVTDDSLTVQVGFFPDMLKPEKGCIDGIRDVNFTMANLCGALYEGIADTYWQYYNELIPEKTRVDRLIFTGGVPHKDPFLVEKISGKLQLRGVVAKNREEVFTGLYQLALIIQGQAGNFAQTREYLENVPIAVFSGSGV